MKLSRNHRLAINAVIIGVSILAWILLLVNPGNIMTMEHCHVSVAGLSTVSLQMLLDMNPLSSQLIGWGLMVIAMMLPKLIAPIQFICQQSLKRYRFINALLFIWAYLSLWMLAGVFLIAIIIYSNLLMPLSYVPALSVVFIAIIWQYSPIKQRFLNLGHKHRILSAFGWSTMRDSTQLGISHGVACVGSGWALMLFPMLMPQGHNLAMFIVTFMMIGEHMEHPQAPQWSLKLRLRLLKIIIAQIKIHFIPYLSIITGQKLENKIQPITTG